ncbi:MAG: hypothetical protein R2699_15800 [Acidimicrobiales bacterium]
MLTAAAVGMGAKATLELACARPLRGVVPLPVGLLALIGAPAMWYFGTSGLETSLSFAWIGATFWVLARRACRLDDRAADASGAGVDEGDGAGSDVDISAPALRVDRPRWALVLLGLGWIVRPELVLSSLLFVGVWVVVHPAGWRRRLAAVGWAVLVPAVFQVFRMGYYGALVPNTALAKSAGSTRWADGWDYAVDFVAYDRLLIPIVGCVAAIGWNLVAARRTGRFAVGALALPVLAGLVQALYVVGHGGDFMHGRLLIVPLFSMLLPAAVVALPRPSDLRSWTVVGVGGAATAAVALWFVGTAASWGLVTPNPSYATTRFGMLRDPAGPDLLEADDFAESHGQRGEHVLLARRAAADGDDLLVDANQADVLGRPQFVDLPPGSGVRLVTGAIGAQAMAAGPNVFVVDLWSLSDPVGSRLDVSEDAPFYDPLVGKYQYGPWVFARHWPPETNDPATATARRALACGDLADLDAAVHDDMSVGRFLSNLVAAPRLSSLSIPTDPAAAEATFCSD